MTIKNTVEINGIEFTYLEAGKGPLVVCVHGFPDTAVTWNDTLEELSQIGYRVIAPFTRGYYPTGIPADQSYTPIDLGQDLLGFIDQFSDGPAIVIGHDWGAMAAYTAANIAPEKISKMVTVAIPHPRSLRPSLSGMWAARHFITFQFRGPTMRKFRRDNYAFVDEIYRRWSPTWDFPASETAPMKEALTKPGVLEAILGYYWSFSKGFRDSDIQKFANGKTSVPTLTIIGDADGALNADTMAITPHAFTGPYRYEIIEGAGHFLHREQPERFLSLVKEF
ncbi:MAG: alpha/beta hydrolase, partial [Chloroflexota bacterium]